MRPSNDTHEEPPGSATKHPNDVSGKFTLGSDHVGEADGPVGGAAEGLRGCDWPDGTARGVGRNAKGAEMAGNDQWICFRWQPNQFPIRI